MALTPKSVCGSLAAQSCEGWAAVWMTELDLAGRARRRSRSTASASRMSTFVASGTPGSARRPAARSRARSRPRGRRSAPACRSRSRPRRSPSRDEVADRLGADQPAGAGDDRYRHPLSPFPPRRIDAERLRRSAPRRPRSTRGCRPASARRCAAAATRPAPKSLRAVGEVDRDVARAASRRPASIGTSLPVSSRQISVVSRSERLHSRPPPTLTVRPSQRSGSSSWRSTRSTRSSTWSRSRTCLPCAAEADVGERVAEVVGEHPVGEDALVDLAHLPGPGDHAAAVDHRRHAERRRGTPRSAARRRAWSRRRGCARRRAGTPRRSRRARRPGSACSAASSKRVSRLLEGELVSAARPGRPG